MKTLLRLLILHILSFAILLTILYGVLGTRFIFLLVIFMPPITVGIGKSYFKLDREDIQIPTCCLLLFIMIITLTIRYLSSWLIPLNLASLLLYFIHLVKFYQKSIRKEMP